MAVTERREQKKVNQNQGQDSSQNSAPDDLHDGEMRMVSEGDMLGWKRVLIILKSWIRYIRRKARA